MPTVTRDGVDLFYELDGEGDGPAVVLAGTAGYGAWQWAWQHGRLAGPREVLVYDHRGTGRSDAPPGPYDVATLAADLEAVLADAGVGRTQLVGAGLGGAVALQYAHTYERARRLALFGTGPGAAVGREAFEALYAPPGDEAACRESLSGALSPAFREANPDLPGEICDWRAEDDAGRQGFEAQTAAWHGFEMPPLYEVTEPTLVLHGVDDPVVPADAGRRLAENLPRGEFVAVEGRHLCFVESARAVTDRLLDFLA